MIEELAVVIHAEKDQVWVETHRSSACSSCSINEGCGTGKLAGIFNGRPSHVRVASEIQLQPGDRVVIGLRESALLVSSLRVYIIPVLLMILGAVLGNLIFTTVKEGMTVLLGVAGLGGGFAWLRMVSPRIQADARFQPVVLRRITTACP